MNNAHHLVKQKLQCILCTKFVKTVLEIESQYYCLMSCLKKGFEIEFIDDNEAVKCRLLEDVLFERRKEYHKRERGLVTPKIRWEILRRDNFRCVTCGVTSKDTKLQIDHIKPIWAGGKSTPYNLRTLCWECNIGKGGFYEN